MKNSVTFEHFKVNFDTSTDLKRFYCTIHYYLSVEHGKITAKVYVLAALWAP